MGDILGLTLRPIVPCSAPASRPLASLANSSIQKYSTDRVQLPIILDFQSDKGKEEIRKWYRKQPTTRFTRLEHRKDPSGRFRHEFIAIYLRNSTVCRFDRRARDDMRGHALKDEGTVSEDTAHVITEADIESKARLDESEVLMSTNFVLGKDVDLKFILAMCCGIQSHPKAKSYSLLHYNCYFFSWTVIAFINRRLPQAFWGSRWMREQYEARTTECVNKVQNSFLNKTKQTRSTWGTGLIRLGWPTTGVDSRQESLLPPIDDYIIRGMEKAIIDTIPRRLAYALEAMLFPSQVSSWLRREVPLALQEGSRLGAQQFFDEAKVRSQLPAPISSERVNPEVLESATYSFLSIDSTYRQLNERAQRKAEKALAKAYDEAIDTFAADLFNKGDLVYELVYLVDHRDNRFTTGQEYLTKRMTNHFKQVEYYGFGKAGRSIKRVEESIADIWVSVLGMVDDNSNLSFL